jgi:hypothetical protein
MFGESTGTDRSTTAPTTAPPRQKRKREPNDYRDSAFYMAHERPVDKGALAAAASDEYLRVHAGERKLDEAVLDLVEDERDGLKKRRSVLKCSDRRAWALLWAWPTVARSGCGMRVDSWSRRKPICKCL